MTHPIDRDLLAGDDPDDAIIEASTAGIPPGQWPEFLLVGDDPYRRVFVRKEAGQVVAAEYYHTRSRKLRKLTVLND